MPIPLNHQTVGNPMTSMSKSTYTPLSSYQRCTNSYTRRSSILDEPQLMVTGSSCLTNSRSTTSDIFSRLSSKPRTIPHYENSYLSSTSALSRKSAIDNKISYKPELSSRYQFTSKYEVNPVRSKKYGEISPSSTTLSQSLLKKPSISTPHRRSISTLTSQSENSLTGRLVNLNTVDNGLPSESTPVKVVSRDRTYSPLRTSIHGAVSSSGRNGLRNIGNTCFLNSIVQCLSHLTPLREYLRSGLYLADINPQSEGSLVKSFANLLNDLWDGENRIIQPGNFKRCLQKFAPCFIGNNQEDAQEFLRYLLEGLHVDVNRVRTKIRDYSDLDDTLSDEKKAMECWKRYLKSDNSKVVDLFVGQLKSTLKCATCGHCSTTFDPFWDLSLSLPDKHGLVRLSQCLDTFTREEILDGNEMPTCSKCQTRRKCTKSLKIQKLPKILVLHLKRFSPSELSRHRKLSTTVDFPMDNLDLSPYTDGCSAAFNLVAIAKHSGTLYSGHYVAVCRENSEWIEFNDERVTPKGPNVGSGDAYLLFYEKTTD